MEKFTKKWDDYINLNWEENLISKKFSVIYPEEIYDKNFNDELLTEEFEKYYNAKVKYNSMTDFFKKEFEEYEEIELLSKDLEFQKYLHNIEEKANKYKDNFEKRINESSKINFENYKTNELSQFSIENIDFKLLALGKVNKETRDTYRKSMPQYPLILLTEDTDKLYDVIFEMDINKFLKTHEEFLENIAIKEKTYSHHINELYGNHIDEYQILNITKENDNVVIDFTDYNQEIIRVFFEKASISEKILELYDDQIIYITTHYIEKYSDCMNIKFEYFLTPKYKGKEIDYSLIPSHKEKEEKSFEITYQNLKTTIIKNKHF